jgi:hypothetical protein
VVFWVIVAAVVVVVLAVAWRADRRRKVTISRRNPAVEGDIARGLDQVVGHRVRNGGRSAG